MGLTVLVGAAAASGAGAGSTTAEGSRTTFGFALVGPLVAAAAVAVAARSDRSQR